MMIEKGDAFARFSAIRDNLFEESVRQSCLERASEQSAIRLEIAEFA